MIDLRPPRHGSGAVSAAAAIQATIRAVTAEMPGADMFPTSSAPRLTDVFARAAQQARRRANLLALAEMQADRARRTRDRALYAVMRRFPVNVQRIALLDPFAMPLVPRKLRLYMDAIARHYRGELEAISGAVERAVSRGAWLRIRPNETDHEPRALLEAHEHPRRGPPAGADMLKPSLWNARATLCGGGL